MRKSEGDGGRHTSTGDRLGSRRKARDLREGMRSDAPSTGEIASTATSSTTELTSAVAARVAVRENRLRGGRPDLRGNSAGENGLCAVGCLRRVASPRPFTHMSDERGDARAGETRRIGCSDGRLWGLYDVAPRRLSACGVEGGIRRRL